MTAGATNEPVGFLADENFEPAIVMGLRHQQPPADILTANEAGTLGMQAPDLLAFAAAHDRILVSHDKRTLPAHFAAFRIAGHDSPGVMLISRKHSIGQSIEALLLIWEASHHNEWRNLITRLPL